MVLNSKFKSGLGSQQFGTVPWLQAFNLCTQGAARIHEIEQRAQSLGQTTPSSHERFIDKSAKSAHPHNRVCHECSRQHHTQKESPGDSCACVTAWYLSESTSCRLSSNCCDRLLSSSSSSARLPCSCLSSMSALASSLFVATSACFCICLCSCSATSDSASFVLAAWPRACKRHTSGSDEAHACASSKLNPVSRSSLAASALYTHLDLLQGSSIFPRGEGGEFILLSLANSQANGITNSLLP